MRELKIDKSITHRENETVMRYLLEIKKYPLLTAEEEVKLAQKIKEGDRAALNMLVNANLRFVVSVAKKYEGNGIMLPDLIAEGNLGLMKAAERFDHTKGFKFISFAVWWIRQSIIFAINEQKRIVRLPTNRILNQGDVWKAEQELEQILERLPTQEEIIDYTNLSADKVRDCYQNSIHCVSFDDICTEEEKHGLLAILEDDTFAPPDTVLIAEGLSKDVRSALNTLPRRQRQILLLHYGLSCDSAKFVDDIANEMDLSVQCVLMNKSKALDILRKDKKASHLKAYL
ncbi:MAG TPA: RNA polymerase sigma factor RpoD/SigA [Pedobacter sp.]|nr:RNA polymerase sigma factor RpoD/SigA [Pedobacter sp.]